MTKPKLTYSDVALNAFASVGGSPISSKERLVRAFELALEDLARGGSGTPKETEEPYTGPKMV
jgi:hypothetical protein